MCVSHLWGEKFGKSQGGNKKILGGFRFYWLEYYFPIGEAYFQGLLPLVSGRVMSINLFPKKKHARVDFQKMQKSDVFLIFVVPCFLFCHGLMGLHFHPKALEENDQTVLGGPP